MTKETTTPQLYNIAYSTLAFQWDGKTPMSPDNKDLPKWVLIHILNNECHSTISDKEQTVHLGNKRGQYVALPGDWICKDAFGHFFVISGKTFPKRAELQKKTSS